MPFIQEIFVSWFCRDSLRASRCCRVGLLLPVLMLLASLLAPKLNADTQPQSSAGQVPVLDLRQQQWGEGQSFSLDDQWLLHWNTLLTPENLSAGASGAVEPRLFDVPGVWTQPVSELEPLPALGFGTYRLRVLIPDALDEVFLYLPDMPSAYRLWVNGEELAANGRVGQSEYKEAPGFLPKTVSIEDHQGELDLLLQLSNFHYREGGIWFSLALTDQSGVFAMRDRPVIFAVFAGAVLIALGLYNCLLFLFRSKEVAAIYFGLLCLTVGLRRLLIDERVFYLFDIASWATLQRIEHLFFYLCVPLFTGFFLALYPQPFKVKLTRVAWVVTVPFFLICLAFPARIYTELNVAFQVLVLLCVSMVAVLYAKELRQRGREVWGFGLSLLVLGVAVVNDVLKANDIINTPNIAHFGVLAFVVSQSIALQRRYLNSLNLVEVMSEELAGRNAELMQLDEFKDEFLATTSHELRTPLHGIAGLAKALRESDEGGFSDDQRNKLTLIANTTKRLSLLVNDILDFSSIKHGKLKLSPTPLDLKSMANVVLATLKPTIGEREVSLKADISDEARYIRADEYRLQQVLFNLLGNAAKFTPKGYIQLQAYLEPDALVIEVDDSGIGIPEEKLPSLFKPFEQAHTENELSAGGSGLGLSISKKIVELHGGSLNVDSRPQRGTSVTMSFPLSILLDASEIGSLQAPKPYGLASADSRETLELQPGLPVGKTLEPHAEQTDAGMTFAGGEHESMPLVFVVDDERVNLELVATQLKSVGYSVELFSDGRAFLERVHETVPDLVLLDYMMPGMNGIEVCQVLRRQFDSYEVPVMMLTARQQVNDIVKALGAGANDYLTKPYHEKELLARVESQLSARKYWVANRENQKLKTEIERREALEKELSILNQRLLNVLDVSDDLVMLVNARQELLYLNEHAEAALPSEDGEFLHGHLISDVLPDELSAALRELLGLDAPGTHEMDMRWQPGNAAEPMSWHVLAKSFREQGQLYIALIMQDKTHAESEHESAGMISGLTHELRESRRKIEQIEGALKQISVMTDSPQQQAVPAESPHGAVAQDAVLDSKAELVKLHRSSLHFWERYSGKGKPELCEQSRCWRVYIDGTTVKTRTFDKYLSEKSLPDKPRWRSVIRTANFVLANCGLNEEDRALLSGMVQQVEDAFS